MPAGVLDGACCSRCGSLSTTTSTCGRPSSTRLATPLKNPGEIDFVVVREGTEGLYTGNGGAIRVGTPHEIGTETSVNTRYGVERVVRDAFARATSRRGKLTLVHKTNVLVNAGGLWQRTVEEVAREFPEVEVDYCHIDAATIYMVTEPSRFDVIVTDNLFGDIITDLAAAVTGGIGTAASGKIDATGTNPSMFEPVHGSAPDIAGQARPTRPQRSCRWRSPAHLGRPPGPTAWRPRSRRTGFSGDAPSSPRDRRPDRGGAELVAPPGPAPCGPRV